MSLRVGNNRRTCAMAAHGLPGLDWLNFFVADFQTSFGPFIFVYLTSTGWTQSDRRGDRERRGCGTNGGSVPIISEIAPFFCSGQRSPFRHW